MDLEGISARTQTGGGAAMTKIKTVMLSEAFLARARQVDLVHFDPRTEAAIVETNGQLAVNSYTPPRHPETPTDDVPEFFLEHMRFLVPIEREFEVFIDWLACAVQRPGQRRWAVVLVAREHGTGRGWLNDLLGLMFGPLVGPVTFQQLIGQGGDFNEWESEKLLLINEEALEVPPREARNGYETLKQKIDPRGPVPTRINPKYGGVKMDKVWHSILISTNHADALIIPPNDRRIGVFANDQRPRDQSYYSELYAALTPEFAARVWWWLKRRDISAFNSHKPPMTDAKAAMIEHSRPPSDRILGYLRDNTVGDLVSLVGLRHLIRVAGSNAGFADLVTDVQIDKIARPVWKELGTLRPDDPSHGFRVRADGRQTEFRALRNRDHWLEVASSPQPGLSVDAAKVRFPDVPGAFGLPGSADVAAFRRAVPATAEGE